MLLRILITIFLLFSLGAAAQAQVGTVRGDPVAIANADGRLELFVIAEWDNSVWHIWQTSAGGSWSAWESLGGWADQLAVTRNRDGRLELFVRGSDRAVHIRSQISAGNSSWYPWGHLGGTVHAIAAAPNQDGRLEAFAIGTDRAVWHTWQTSPGGVWSGWNSLGGWADQLTVARNNDGRLEVFVRGSDRAMHHNWQTRPNGSWSGWGHLGGTIDQIAVTQNAGGGLEVFTVGTDNGIWRNRQVSAGGSWSGWSSLRPWLDRVAVARNSDGRLEVFGRGSDQALWHNWQGTPTSGFGGWAYQGGAIYQPVVERNSDGRLEVFTRGTDGLVHHKWQMCAGCGWTGWTPLPRINPPPARCWNDPPQWFGHKESPNGPLSDPLNVILCFEHGRTWAGLFSELVKIRNKQIPVFPQPAPPAPPQYITVGFEEVFDPESLPPYLDGHCISSVFADVQSGSVDQAFSAREGGCGISALIAYGINHFRIWQQPSSMAAFMSVSTETGCLLTHCVISFDDGRAQLIALMNQAAANAGWPLPNVDIIRAVPAGSISQPLGSSAPYDGNVWIVTFR